MTSKTSWASRTSDARKRLEILTINYQLLFDFPRFEGLGKLVKRGGFALSAYLVNLLIDSRIITLRLYAADNAEGDR